MYLGGNRVEIINESINDRFPCKEFRRWINYIKNESLSTDLYEKDLEWIKKCTTLKIDLPQYESPLGQIKKLDGIELFENLELLDCSLHMVIKKLDVSANKKLKYLNCSINHIHKLYLPPSIEILDCSCNPLSKLKLFYAKDLKILDCNFTNIKRLNLKENNLLERVDVSNSDLHTIIFNRNIKLKSLYCPYTDLKATELFEQYPFIQEIYDMEQEIEFLNDMDREIKSSILKK